MPESARTGRGGNQLFFHSPALMRNLILSITALLALASWCWAQPEFSRREYSTPGLVLQPGGRTGACDVLQFTPDGQYLLAAGDDKVVRNWKVNGQRLELSDLPALRWAIFRESRGNIYTVALSPKKGVPEVAVAGSSKYVGGFGVAVIERSTGKVLRGLRPAQAVDSKKTKQMGSIWALEYNATGEQLLFATDWREAWVWDLDGDPKDNPRRVLSAPPGTKNPFNRPYLAAYGAPGKALVVDQPGVIRQVSIPGRGAAPDPNPREVYRIAGAQGIRNARLSPDRKWLALAPELNRVEVLSFPSCQLQRTITFEKNGFPVSVAFDPTGNRLAVGLRLVTPHANADFLREDAYYVRVYDLRPQAPRMLHQLELTGNPEAVAFSPLNSDLLATAGGANHEVSLWDLRQKATLVSTVPSQGRCLWGVGLSPDGQKLAFQNAPLEPPASPNQRGSGAWHVFDLKTRTWLPDNSFQPNATPAEYRGWRVLTKLNGKIQAVQWYVQGPGQVQPEPLPWDRSLADFPRCYTFLPPLGPGRPVRLAVGHMFGISIFDLVPGNIRRTKLLYGHDGDVMALAASADGRRLVSTGRDMTIDGWNLEDWPNHPTLGARLGVEGGKLLVVTEPVKGSPLWEVGLSRGDEVLLLAVGGSLRFNRYQKYGGNVGTPEQALAALEASEPHVELYFAFRRQRDGKIGEQLTSLFERPVWRFFPTARRDWVLWRWRDFLYDTRTTGDHLIGWVETRHIEQTPVFIHARDRAVEYFQPEKVAETTLNWSREQGQSGYDQQIMPIPEVHLLARAAGITVPAQQNLPEAPTLKVRMKLRPPDLEAGARTTAYQIPDRVYLWVNDYLVKQWDLSGKPKGAVPFQDVEVTEDIPVTFLRQGRNDLTLQVQTQAEHQAATVQALELQKKRAKPNLHVLLVAVSDYTGATPLQRDLQSVKDAQVMEKVWRQQAGKHFNQVQVYPLFEKQVSQANVLSALARLNGGNLQSDDVLVVQLGGHGVLRRDLLRATGKTEQQLEKMGVARFMFLCPNFSINNLRATTISLDRLYEELVKMPCVKILMFDACHSGEARADLDRRDQPLRILTQKRIGPIILAACKADQTAQELAFGPIPVDEGGAYGIFTTALRQVLEEKFAEADRNGDQQLQAGEVVRGIAEQLQAIVNHRRGILGAQELDGYIPDTLRQFVVAVK